MKYIICDDNLDFSEYLKSKIKRYSPDTKILICSTIAELKFKLEDNAKETDAIFMDIQNKDGNGIEAAVDISNKYPHIKIVYVTGYGNEFSQSIFLCPPAANPVAFLTKPLQDDYLINALMKISENTEAGSLTVKDENGTSFIHFKDIISISSEGRKLNIVTKEAEHHTYGEIKNILKKLPSYFMQCHRSHIVSIKHIEKLDGWNSIIMKNNCIFPIARSHKENVKRIITENY